MNDMKILETYKNIAIIQITEGNYCVSIRLKGSFFKKERTSYYCLDRCGTDLLCDDLINEVTTTDSLERARLVFNCNALKMGKVPT